MAFESCLEVHQRLQEKVQLWCIDHNTLVSSAKVPFCSADNQRSRAVGLCACFAFGPFVTSKGASAYFASSPKPAFFHNRLCQEAHSLAYPKRDAMIVTGPLRVHV